MSCECVCLYCSRREIPVCLAYVEQMDHRWSNIWPIVIIQHEQNRNRTHFGTCLKSSVGPAGGERRRRDARIPRGERREGRDGSVWAIGESGDHAYINTYAYMYMHTYILYIDTCIHTVCTGHTFSGCCWSCNRLGDNIWKCVRVGLPEGTQNWALA